MRARIVASLRAPLTALRLAQWFLASLAIAACLHAAAIVIGPMLANPAAMGMHDWDSLASQRYITTLSLKKFHEFPGWHPYMCGGFAAWAYGEGAPNLVSPFLPAHLLLPVTVALRVEIVGFAAIGMLGTYFFAGRFTKNTGLRILVVVVYMLNGRYALQIASGHAWHEQYAWTPWVLYALDVAAEKRGRMRAACWGGAAMAMIVYGGGIYPLPHTALAASLYAVFLAIGRRRIQPLLALGVLGVVAIGLSAPKLLPIIELMKRFPRKIDSTEAIGFGPLLEMLGNDTQTFVHGTAAVPAYGWHEWGIYVGPIVIGCMVIVFFWNGDARFSALRAIGIIFFVLGLGAFHELAPWTLLHKLPVFSSQHVPSRFFAIGVLMLVTAFVARVDAWLPRGERAVASASLLLLVPAWIIAVDIARVGANSTRHVFYLELPKVEPLPAFTHAEWPQFNYTPADAWAGPTLLAMQRNEGFIQCYSVPDRGEPRGAKSRTNAGYRGEAYVASGPGKANVVEWSPNHAVVAYSDVSPGSTLVYNMNWDPGWHADGQPALDVGHAVGAKVAGPSGQVTFRYRPVRLRTGLLLALLTLVSVVFGPRLWRRWLPSSVSKWRAPNV